VDPLRRPRRDPRDRPSSAPAASGRRRPHLGRGPAADPLRGGPPDQPHLVGAVHGDLDPRGVPTRRPQPRHRAHGFRVVRPRRQLPRHRHRRDDRRAGRGGPLHRLRRVSRAQDAARPGLRHHLSTDLPLPDLSWERLDRSRAVDRVVPDRGLPRAGGPAAVPRADAARALRRPGLHRVGLGHPHRRGRRPGHALLPDPTSAARLHGDGGRRRDRRMAHPGWPAGGLASHRGHVQRQLDEPARDPALPVPLAAVVHGPHGRRARPWRRRLAEAHGADRHRGAARAVADQGPLRLRGHRRSGARGVPALLLRRGSEPGAGHRAPPFVLAAPAGDDHPGPGTAHDAVRHVVGPAGRTSDRRTAALP
jgi:hypothetical protein